MPCIASCIPCVKRLDEENNDQNNSQNNGQCCNDKCGVWIEGLASGIYLGLLMLFMIPETIDDFGEVWSSKIKGSPTINTMALGSICLGLFLVAIIEYLAAKASCYVRAQSTVEPADQQANQSTVQPPPQQTIQTVAESSNAQTAPSEDEENPGPEARPFIEDENRPVDCQANEQESTAHQKVNQPRVQPKIQLATGSSTAQTSPSRGDVNPVTDDCPQAHGEVGSTTDCQICIRQKNKMDLKEVWSYLLIFE